MARSPRTQLRVGRLTKAHGLKGALKLELYTDDPERRFVPGAVFSLQVPESSPWHGKHLTFRELRWYNQQPVGFFEGVDDRTAAESLVKAILWVDHVDEEPAEPDAWYDHQLIGLDVVRDGTKIGSVVSVEHLPAQDLLIVKHAGREVMVPFVNALVPEVDIETGTVTVTPPPGLFEELAEEAAAPAEPASEEAAAPVESAGSEEPAPSEEPAASGDPAASGEETPGEAREPGE
ncbi:ribosome maturation factor RimM [Agromyces archimandritae]|uniref:Ribosome maturation factor RimM n=1 Tax=Agromyces archimandritae TaxID=2781962 RepID=A0A975INE2_9MICO|nr:ribosome maturation factor RimM [Agromyces archimandritae]QTX04475.1 ribosome maturation factor RimM [Agromyces archimandritae]